MFEVVSQLPVLYEGSRKTWEEFNFMRDVPDKFIFEGRFYKDLYDQWKYVKENLDPDPVIIDSDELLSDPKHMLSKYCAALGIPYSDGLTEWDGDPTSVDVWWHAFHPLNNFQFARIFCGNAMNSKAIRKPEKLPSLEELSEDVKESYEIVKPYYEEMYNTRMKP